MCNADLRQETAGPETKDEATVSERPGWGEPQRPEGGQPPDDAWPGEPTGSGPDGPAAAPPAPDIGQPDGPDDGARLPPPPGAPPVDPNSLAIDRAGLPPDQAEWLREVARQVEPRLDRVAPDWRRSPQAEAARACAFGLLLGYLARTYPHARGDLSRAAEAHPSYGTLPAGNRLGTLEQISADPQRMAAWLGPLIDVGDPQRLRNLLD